MYKCLMKNIKFFSIKNKLDSLLYIDSKPMYIDDAYNNVVEDIGCLDTLSFYKLIKEGVKSVKVFRKPIIGILHEDPPLGKSLSYFGNKLGLFTIDLGLIRSAKDIERGLRLSDILVIASSYSMEIKDNRIYSFIPLKWMKFTETYVSRYKNNLLVILDENNIISLIGIILYFIRPYLHYFFKEPILFNPVNYIRNGRKTFEIYAVDESLNIIHRPNSLLGYKIICEDGVFIEKIII